jgi:dynein heavy chain, axonemal
LFSLRSKINFFAQFYHDLGWPFLQVAREKVFNFKQTLPLITYLKNPAMQKRHWDKVREVTGKDFDETSDTFNLATIIDMNLQNYGDFINEISNAATMEMQIEKGIQNIEEVWGSLKIALTQYKDVYWKIQSVDECTQRLEDDLVAISAMKSTKFVEPFEKKVNYWERTLSYVYETIEMTMQVQRKWLYFEEIFQGDDIRRDMKTEADLFQELCEEWQLITENLKQSPIIVEGFLYVPPPQLFAALTIMLEKLETIQKALEIYLEQKRYIFPRFYFISNDDLLEVCSKQFMCQAPSHFYLSDPGQFQTPQRHSSAHEKTL